jgi:hypothetical protein
VEVAGAKVVLVGDHRQLGAVGPGGALEALVSRHRDQVQVLYENRRQADPAEAQALAALRAGDVEEAVSWYRGGERIVAGRSRDEALDRAVDAWAADVAQGKETALLAWRRANVEELNHRARQRMDKAGRLTGPELVAPGGRSYQAGDQVVTLAPGADGALVTSERAVVERVDLEHKGLMLRTEDERRVGLVGEEVSAERLAHGYAVTTHRSQGQTTDRAHVYVDGGGRELAYVGMSRAQESSHAYLVADNLDQAAEDLVREWSAERRMGWVTDVSSPAPAPTVETVADRPDLESARTAALSHARLSATFEARRDAIPPDLSLEIVAVNRRLREVRDLRRDLDRGEGVWANTEAGRAARGLMEARRKLAHSAAMTEHAGWRERRFYRKEAAIWSEKEAEALGRWAEHGAPEARRLDRALANGDAAIEDLRTRRDNVADRPDKSKERSTMSARSLSEFERDMYAQRDHLDGIEQSSVSRDLARQSRVGVPGALDHEELRGISRDISHGLGR